MTRLSTIRRKRPLGLLAFALVSVAMLMWIAPSGADPAPADLTTVDITRDGSGHCLDENAGPACNEFDGTAYAWVGGDPIVNELPDGQYFFAVLSPSNTVDPNDGGAGNLSDNFDAYTNREFTVENGAVTTYDGTHDSDLVGGGGYSPAAGLQTIRLSPYLPSLNLAGIYQLAICLLGQNGHITYPVSLNQCRLDNYKVPIPDRQAPGCEQAQFGHDSDGHAWVRQRFTDSGGIDSLTVGDVGNATWNVQSFFRGSPGPVTMTATKIDQTHRSHIHIWVRDVAGNMSQCDPVLATMRGPARNAGTQRFTRLARDESKVMIRNGRPGYRTVSIVVNGKLFSTISMRNGQTTRLNVRKLMRSGKGNTIVIRGQGSIAARADIVIAN